MIGAGRGRTALRRPGGPVVARRPRPARRVRRLPRPGPRFLVVVVAVLALAAGGWVWLRSSSLVAVQRVTVIGVSGPDAGQIRSALIDAARSMTTLNVKMGSLRTAVEPYPVVKQLHVSTGFPHRMRIEVVEQVPVAMISAAGRQTTVSADGTLLHDTAVTGALPTISVDVTPGGTHVTGVALSEVRLLAAAPYALLAKVAEVSSDAAHGLVAQLRNGPKLIFGTGGDVSAKWISAVAVLADSSSAGAPYIDVTVPARPAAGAGSDTGGAPAGTSVQGASGTATSQG
jgi:cell division protein FtsQ